MKIQEILQTYDTHLLDQISADKVDEAITLRLPTAVIMQEIVSALSSQSYISNKILYARPPAYAILDLILQSPAFTIAIEGFQVKVTEYVRQLSQRAMQINTLNKKHTQLYTKILKRAWENDNLIDKSEAHILELVKQELGIWDREHYLLLHDESIIGLWNIEQEFYSSRNQLLSSGIVLTHNNHYVIAEEVAFQIRKAFGIEIIDSAFQRLLNCLTKEDLAFTLEAFQFNVSGTKQAMTERLVSSLIPATDILSVLHLDSLRSLCRDQNIPVSGVKNIVIANIIEHFDKDRDLYVASIVEEEVTAPKVPETREMDGELYQKILQSLTVQQLYDILYQTSIMTSGTKEEKIRRIVESPWSERSILAWLRKEDLSQLCKRFQLAVSGSKQELIDRLIDYTPTIENESNPVIRNEAEVEPTSVAETEDYNSNENLKDQFDAPPLPSNWQDVNELFPYLRHDEKIVLAILMEAKSLTEKDLERIVIKHKLGWFLQKANMAELIAKLKRNGKSFIQIRSVQNNNIYQWASAEKTNEVLEKKSARDIIDALRHGVVPKHNLDLLVVGQETARKHLSEILLEVNSHKSHFKFIRGQYGSGKTFLCSWLKEFALENEFAVSFMNISHDQPLSDLPVFFSGLVNGLRTPEKTDSSALLDILESWLLNIHNKTAKIEGIDASGPSSQKQLSKIVEKSIEVELASLNDIEPGFSQALRAFYEGKANVDLELVSNAVAWITGSRSLSSQALRDIGVKGYLEANNVFPRMRAILEIISGARYKGLLLLVDELELIRKFPHARQREQALESLRLLIDEAGRNALPGCLLIFTGTDEFFEDERYGLRSYEALAERVMTPFTHQNFVSMRQPIISLESLDSERLTKVIFKIRDLYSIAYGCDAKQFGADESIKKLIAEWTLFGDESIERKPRPILREFIQMLDLCEENKGVELSQFLKQQPEMVADSSFSVN
jgi:hypothetical protein